MSTPKEIRLASGKSQAWVAVHSGTSEPTVRLYEANPGSVTNPVKRTALDKMYAGLEAKGGRR